MPPTDPIKILDPVPLINKVNETLDPQSPDHLGVRLANITGGGEFYPQSVRQSVAGQSRYHETDGRCCANTGSHSVDADSLLPHGAGCR